MSRQPIYISFVSHEEIDLIYINKIKTLAILQVG